MIKIYPVLLVFCLPAIVANAQYCTNVGPTSSADSDLQSFSLPGESATAISYTGVCPGVIGFNDQAAFETVTLNAGGSYTATAGFGTCNGNYAGVGQGWIDYNQNYIFEASESIGTWSGTPPVAPASWNFTVPAGAIAGVTRMRVVHYEGGFLPIDPCSQFTWGSTVDFTVQIGGGMDCSGYVGDSMDDPRIVTALPYNESHSTAVCYTSEQTTYASPDVFYRILPQQLAVNFLAISLCGSAFDTYLSVLDADGNVLWYNDDEGSCTTGSGITVPVNGIDTLYIVVQGWGSASGDYDIEMNAELTGISTYVQAQYNLFPNPAAENFTIRSNQLIQHVTIYDLGGKVINSIVSPGNGPIDISTIEAGTYLVKVVANDSESFQKLVVE